MGASPLANATFANIVAFSTFWATESPSLGANGAAMYAIRGCMVSPSYRAVVICQVQIATDVEISLPSREQMTPALLGGSA